MNIDLTVWASVALMHFVAVISPGPDFAIILKQSLQKGRAAAIWTSLGVGSGILLHVSYSILGVSVAIMASPWLFNSLLYLAAIYFVYIGVSGLRSKKQEVIKEDATTVTQSHSSWFKAFGLGFLINGLNPKASLFFLALFTVAIPPSTELEAKVFYGVYLALATALWFCFLSYIASIQKLRKAYQAHGYVFDRIMGLVMIVMAVLLVLA